MRKSLTQPEIKTVISFFFFFFVFNQDGQCRFKPENIGAKSTGYVDAPARDEDALKEAVATIGPVSVGIDASHPSFQLYESG